MVEMYYTVKADGTVTVREIWWEVDEWVEVYSPVDIDRFPSDMDVYRFHQDTFPDVIYCGVERRDTTKIVKR